jgi:hypothetical protein
MRPLGGKNPPSRISSNKVRQGRGNMPNSRNQNYEEILKAVRVRLKRLNISETEGLSLGFAVNLLFLMRGELATIGEYAATINALGELLGRDVLWEPPKNVLVTGSSAMSVC